MFDNLIIDDGDGGSESKGIYWLYMHEFCRHMEIYFF
jgi:hypothetical protein